MQSKIIIKHLSCSERSAQKAGARWWIYVDGIGFLPNAGDVREDTAIVVDAPPKTPWKAGLERTRGTKRLGSTVEF